VPPAWTHTICSNRGLGEGRGEAAYASHPLLRRRRRRDKPVAETNDDASGIIPSGASHTCKSENYGTSRGGILMTG